jgi:hypothetical protein
MVYDASRRPSIAEISYSLIKLNFLAGDEVCPIGVDGEEYHGAGYPDGFPSRRTLKAGQDRLVHHSTPNSISIPVAASPVRRPP